MQIVCESLNAICRTASNAIEWFSLVCVIGISATTFLLFTEKISFEDIKNLFKRDRKR